MCNTGVYRTSEGAGMTTEELTDAINNLSKISTSRMIMIIKLYNGYYRACSRIYDSNNCTDCPNLRNSMGETKCSFVKKDCIKFWMEYLSEND